MLQALIRDLTDDIIARLRAKATARYVPMQVFLKETVETGTAMTVANRIVPVGGLVKASSQ